MRSGVAGRAIALRKLGRVVVEPRREAVFERHLHGAKEVILGGCDAAAEDGERHET